jgi:hypothetical protein
VNGFHFNNEFPPRPDVTINVPPIGIIGIGDASNGLCGGMVYAARDFFDAALPILFEAFDLLGVSRDDVRARFDRRRRAEQQPQLQRRLASVLLPDGRP